MLLSFTVKISLSLSFQVNHSPRRCLIVTPASLAVRSSTTVQTRTASGYSLLALQPNSTEWLGTCSCTLWSVKSVSPSRDMLLPLLRSNYQRTQRNLHSSCLPLGMQLGEKYVYLCVLACLVLNVCVVTVFKKSNMHTSLSSYRL